MKKITIAIIIAVAAAVICVISVEMIETLNAEYAAELAMEQMQIEGSQAYAAYSEIAQDIETVQFTAAVCISVCAIAIIIAIIYKIFKSKE